MQRILITAVFFYAMISIIANNIVPQIPTEGMSPNARSFNRYGEVPVSLYTGTPNIKIPLAKFRERNLTLPIELSYHSGGLKAEEHPGSTGLGWTLMAGGAITREKRDLPDELDQIGFFNKRNSLTGLDKHPNLVDSLLLTYGQSVFFSFDLEPDKYNFHFLDYSGFFMMDTKGEWRVYCDKPLKVESYTLQEPEYLDSKIFPQHNSKIISTFTLLGEDGTRYTFGDDGIDLNIDFLRQNSAAWEATAWHLKKIEHPGGDVFAYEYIRGDYLASFSNVQQYAWKSDLNGNPVATHIPKFIQGRLISPVYLSSIRSLTYRAEMNYTPSVELDYADDDYYLRLSVDFNDEASRPIYITANPKEQIKWYQLDYIDLYCDEQYYQKIEFEYTSDHNIRLMLNGIKFNSVKNEVYEQYKFKYHHPQKMPSYLSGETDHWGYYNGIKNDIDSLWQTKKPDPICMRYGSLYEITYPTGGKTVFEYEANRYSRVANSNTAGDLCEVKDTIAGGIRIKKIYDIPNDSSAVRIKEYKYYRVDGSMTTTDTLSSGILECSPIYKIDVPCIDNASIREEADQPLSNIINNSGLHVGYQSVVELESGGGCVIHKFTSFADSAFKDTSPISQNLPTLFLPLSGRSQYRGMPLKEDVYNASGELVRTREYTYKILGEQEDYVHSFYFQVTPLKYVNSQNASEAYHKYSLYKTFVHSMKVESILEKSYEHSQNKAYEVSRYFRYNNKGQLRCDSIVTRYNKKNRSQSTIYNYQWEQDDLFSGKHILSHPATIATYDNNQLLHTIKTEYSFSEPKNNLYVSSVTKRYSNKDIQTLYSCIYADKKGRPLLIQTSDGSLIGYLWTAYSIKPIVSIAMSDITTYDKIKDINIQEPMFEEYMRPLFANLRAELPEAMVTGYIYTPWCGVTAIIDPAGKEIQYHYDDYGRLIEECDNEGNVVTRYDYSTATTLNTTIDR